MSGEIFHPPHTRSGERQVAEGGARREGRIKAGALAGSLRDSLEASDFLQLRYFIGLFCGLGHFLLLFKRSETDFSRIWILQISG